LNALKFNTISITEATNLAKVSANTFKGTSDDINQIDLDRKNQLGESGQIKELFDVFSSLPNLRKLHLNTQIFDRITENASKNKQNN